MNCIRYHELEQLISFYPTLNAILRNFELDLKLSKEREELDNDIYAICMEKHGEGIPSAGKISDITGNVAVQYRRSSKLIQKEMKKEILELSAIIDKINAALNSLTVLQRMILELYYWGEPKTWAEILEAIKTQKRYISKRLAQLEREKGIKKMMSIMKLDVATYNRAIELVEGKKGDM